MMVSLPCFLDRGLSVQRPAQAVELPSAFPRIVPAWTPLLALHVHHGTYRVKLNSLVDVQLAQTSATIIFIFLAIKLAKHKYDHKYHT